MDAIRSYLLGLLAAVLAVSILLQLLPKNAVKKAAALCCGLLLVLASLAPLLRIDFGEFAAYLAKAGMEADFRESGIEITDCDLLSRIIQEKTEAYILDKASEIGAEVTVSITMETDGAYPYPKAAELHGVWTEVQRSALALCLEEAIGIPQERQVFVRETPEGTP